MLRLPKLAVQECLVQQLHMEIYLAVFSEERTAILASRFVLTYITNYIENNRTLVHLLILFT
jgi:hypothetical protein